MAAQITLYTAASLMRAKTDCDGHFRLEDVAPGEARLVVTRSGFARADKTLRLDSRAARDDCPVALDAIDLSEAGVVEGEVLDARGDPVSGARVARGAVPGFVPSGRVPTGVAVTNRRGEFRLEDLPEGEATLEAYAPLQGRGKASGVVVTAGRTTDRVRITLSGKDGASDDSNASGGVAVTLISEPLGVVVSEVASGSEAERAGISLATGWFRSMVDR